MPDKRSLQAFPIAKKKRSQQVYEALLEDLQNEEWTETLPGIKALSIRYAVSLAPVQEALKRLERDQFIGPALDRKARRILKKREKKTAPKTFLLLHRAIHTLSSPGFDIYQNLKTRLRKHHLTFITMEVDQGQKNFTRIRSQLKSATLTGVISLEIDYPIVRRIVGKSIAVLHYGPKSEFENRPRTAYCYCPITKIFVQAVRMLIDQSVEKIGIITDYQKATKLDIIRSLDELYSEYDLNIKDRLFFLGAEHREIESYVRELLMIRQVDLIIVSDANIWGPVIHMAYDLDIHIPIHVLWDSYHFDAHHASPTLIKVDILDFINATMKWIGEIKAGEIPTWTEEILVRKKSH
jgi:DNA-binding LacI/PurR family transcriptional regulator